MGKGKGTLKSEIKVLKVPSRFDLVAWAFIKFCYLKRRRLLETGQLFGTGSLFFFEKQQNLQTRLEEDAIRLKELCTPHGHNTGKLTRRPLFLYRGIIKKDELRIPYVR